VLETSGVPFFDTDGRLRGYRGISRDITERKHIEDDLRESTENWRSLVSTLPDYISLLDREGRFLFLNHYADGFTEKEVIGSSVYQYLSPESKEIFEKEIAGCQTTGKIRKFEHTAMGAHGIMKEYEDYVVPIPEKNKTTNILVVSRDITERKQSENALRENEERYRTLIDKLPDYIFVHTKEDVVYVNPAAVRSLGYTKQELLTTPITRFIAPGSHEIIKNAKQQRAAGVLVNPYEIMVLTKDGTTRTCLVQGSRIIFNNAPSTLIVLTDITERKQSEEALRESEERYRIVTDAAHDVIYTLSLEGVVTFMNSGGSALIGMSPEKIVGLSLESLYHADIAQELRENLDKVISTKRPVRFDSKFWRGNHDQVTWLDAQLVPQFGPDGSVVQVMGISRSITDRKQAEMLLKRFNEDLESQVRSRTIELERLNAMLEVEVIQRTMAEDSIRNSLHERELLLREIHHRVRNNLQIILSLINLQSRNIKDPYLLDTMGDFQNRIKAMAHVHERMYLTDDIGRIDLSEIVTFLRTSLFRSYKVDPQHIRLNVEMKDLQITIDSAIPISLILNELISNSIKHAFPQGTPGEITIEGHREGYTLALSVRDTGIGLPKDYDWTTGKQSLGHRLVISLVEQLQGTIELDLTTGTTFNIIVKEK
jgi:PAS domain S-box-containing protein